MNGRMLTRRVRDRDITLTVRWLGRDCLVEISGGDAPHIGAAAVADAAGGRCLVRPGHREGELALSVAERAAAALECCVCVVCGIHYEAVTRPEIEAVLDAVRDMTDTWLGTGSGRA